MFCVETIFFLLSFLYFFTFSIFGIPDIERSKRNLLIGQPHQPDQFKWCVAAASNVAIVVSVIADVVLYPAIVLHRTPVPAFG